MKNKTKTFREYLKENTLFVKTIKEDFLKDEDNSPLNANKASEVYIDGSALYVNKKTNKKLKQPFYSVKNKNEWKIVKMDLSVPITRERCKEVLSKYGGKKLNVTTFNDNWEDKKMFEYEDDCLTIYQEGLPIYQDNKGQITDDEALLAEFV